MYVYGHDYSVQMYSLKKKQTLGQIGRVAQVNLSGTVEVLLQGRGWLYHPKCLLPAPGETARGDVDPQCKCSLPSRLNDCTLVSKVKLLSNAIREEGKFPAVNTYKLSWVINHRERVR